ncbi:MAG TPA: DUF4331 domain-containing protein [Acidimicrobiales bacterium]|nr:DUF4331 domain-containing protein [Acidimicrobiales bacterium]
MQKSRGKVILATAAVGTLGVLGTLVPGGASSHREAPAISQDPSADATDLYAFVSPEDPSKVTFIANYSPLEDPSGGPNFHRFGDDVQYEINIDNDGDAATDLSYQFRFQTQVQNAKTFLYATGPIDSVTDPDFNMRQLYSVNEVREGVAEPKALIGGASTAPANIGPRSNQNYEAVAQSTVYPFDTETGQAKVFAGPRDDPFFVDLGGLRPLNKAHLIKLAKSSGRNSVAGFNVHSIALQVPISELTADRKGTTGADDPDAVIGVYTTAKRTTTRTIGADGSRSGSGDLVSVSRLGNPLVNEVVVPLGAKDYFNGSDPKDDATKNGGAYVPLVTDPELAKLIPVLYPGVNTPPAPRNDLVSIFLTGIDGVTKPMNAGDKFQPAELLRLNMGISPRSIGRENRLGVLGGDNAGFPNGRRLADDVVDIALRAVAGGTPFTPEFNHAPNNALTDGVDKNDRPFTSRFPYLAEPHQGYARQQLTPGR